ncbi:MAG TPA: GspE/PulE family protein [Nevskiaceae bacterium]|nr:GspE/PulE family protein [Nevskiaceae bacterium]
MSRLLNNADKFSDEQVAQTITLLIEHGLKRNASDIHIEPHDRFVLVRYRIDGTLHGLHKLPRAALDKVIQQLKEQARLNTAATNMPQEGSYTAPISGQNVQVRVSTLPVLGGEKVVLHLSAQREAPLSLETIGFWGDGLHLVQTALARPQGLVLVAGPRHAGTATTLHSLIGLLHAPSLNIATVEDPLEQRLPNVSQTQAQPHAGLSFLDSLHAVLRQDPNVVMLSNLPDQPVAELAVHAAVTGHLVLAGLHADSAIAALLHVRAMNVRPFLLATGLRLCIGQRLVRRLCAQCRERYAPDATELHKLEKRFDMTTAPARKRVHLLEQQAAQAGMGTDKLLNSTPAHITHLWRKSDDGCEACHHTGYTGGLMIVEVLSNSDHLQKLLSGTPTASALHSAALKDGFTPMALDGLIKALRGETSLDEVLRGIE